MNYHFWHGWLVFFESMRVWLTRGREAWLDWASLHYDHEELVFLAKLAGFTVADVCRVTGKGW